MANSSRPVSHQTSQTLPPDSNVLRHNPSNLRNRSLVAVNTSTEDDPVERMKKKILASKTMFHKHRAIQILRLPKDVTEREIRDMLSDFPIRNVKIVTTAKETCTARVKVEDPLMLEDYHGVRYQMRDSYVPVFLTRTEGVLCVARLPLDFSENQFYDLVKSCGKVDRSFLMISEKTGESKGYGFVVYKTASVAKQARVTLHNKPIGNYILACDWLSSIVVNFQSLHSLCLYVNNIPKNFRNMSQFREIFSAVASPSFCQIALQNGVPQDWGLVEYDTSEDAEISMSSLNGYYLCSQNIRISYYIPGVRALDLYHELLHEQFFVNRAEGLLPEPSRQDVVHNLQRLSRLNPSFAQELWRLLPTHIRAAENGDLDPGVLRRGYLQDPGRRTVYTPWSYPPGLILPLISRSNPLTTKIPLLPTPSGPPIPRQHSLSPTAGELTPPLIGSAPPGGYEKEGLNCFIGLVSQQRVAPSSPIAYHSDTLPHPISVENPSNLSVEAQPISFFNNTPDIEDLDRETGFLQSLSPSPSLAPPPNFPYPRLNPMQGRMDPSWALVSSVHQPMSLVTISVSTRPIPVPMSPKPPRGPPMFPTWAPPLLSPPPQSLPFGSPEIIWPQASPTLSPELNPMITPSGQKRSLPSREPSPERNYVGQHFRGIGGLYTNSYFKKSKY